MRAAAEMARVVRPVGRIGMVNRTPDSLVVRMFKVLGTFAPPLAGIQPPSLWGIEAHVRSLFGDTVATVQATPKPFTFR